MEIMSWRKSSGEDSSAERKVLVDNGLCAKAPQSTVTRASQREGVQPGSKACPEQTFTCNLRQGRPKNQF